MYPILKKSSYNEPLKFFGYPSTRIGGSKRTTIIKKISGNKELFLDELRAVLSISADDNDAIRLRAAGNTIEVNGNRTKEVKKWLAGLGF